MKILVCPHELSIGGSQINAIDLAAKIAERGHDVSIYARPGPLQPYVRDKGLRYIEARPLRYRPAPSRVLQLARLAKRERFELIHAFEWPACLEAHLGASLVHRVPLVCTVLSMEVSPLVPPTVPLIMGTRHLTSLAETVHTAAVHTLEPPIDTGLDHPGIDGSAFRSAHGVADRETLLVSVSRVAVDLKLDALTELIDSAGILAHRNPVRLVIVGDGDAFSSVRERAARVNAACGRDVVTLAGAVLDPRPAYAAADIVLGMGSSALRGMSFAKPVIVQGENGFSRELSPATSPLFLHQGFWGVGDGPAPERLAAQVERLVCDPAERRRLGDFGRRLVVERFGLDSAATAQLDIYERVVDGGPRRSVVESMVVCARAASLELHLHDPRRKRAFRRDRDVRLSEARVPSTIGAESAVGVAS